MPTGDFFIDSREIDLLAAKLKAATGSAKEMRPTMKRISERAAEHVRSRAPIGHGSPKDSRSHLPPGSLRAGIRATSTATRASVRADWNGPLILQEFGGQSIWHKGQAGSLRTRGHRKYNVSKGMVSAGGASARGHLVYEKQRLTRGHFIWNVAYRLRTFIGNTLAEGLAASVGKYGIEIDVAGCDGDFQSEPFK